MKTIEKIAFAKNYLSKVDEIESTRDYANFDAEMSTLHPSEVRRIYHQHESSPVKRTTGTLMSALAPIIAGAGIGGGIGLATKSVAPFAIGSALGLIGGAISNRISSNKRTVSDLESKFKNEKSLIKAINQSRKESEDNLHKARTKGFRDYHSYGQNEEANELRRQALLHQIMRDK